MSRFKKKERPPAATAEQILSVLSGVMDPELGRDLVSLNMIRNVAVAGGEVSLDLVLTTPACPKKAEMQEAVERAVRSVPGVSLVDVRVSAEVQGSRDPMEGRRPVEGVRNIVTVASGKGGVGKSTISANLAVALHRTGARVGLLDADIYGPSIPTLLNLTSHQLMGANGMILPAETDGLKVLSIGFMLEEDSPVIWRGPMLMKALEQFLHGTKWGELDYLVIDLPPGTGDVQLSLVQMTPVAGAIVVTTPQDLALIDVKKAVRMFEKVGVPILGVIENMSYFLCPHCDGRSEIFGHGGAERTCREMGLKFLGEVPLEVTLREASDAGVPIVSSRPDSPAAVAITRAASEAAAALAVLAKV
ncbi:MAG TPA: iron-sulfur cluster carrier protein ApbC [Candidatus Deferrimicrobiaceae bacterium]|nr:iron-sulfur cluster carrier protein ApbC [Candidatus Deferrimicrobiaceae bacterium]